MYLSCLYYTPLFIFFFFFFFQAEDGIRDLTVTGVQTCALPISSFIFGENFISEAAADPRVECAGGVHGAAADRRSEEHTSELQSQSNIVCRLLLGKKRHSYMKRLVDAPDADLRSQASATCQETT